MEKTEGKVIFPVGDIVEGKATNAWLTERLTNLFGGLTVTEGLGFWKDPLDGAVVSEKVRIYTVAGMPHESYVLQNVAVELCQRSKESYIYVKRFDGEVYLSKC